MTRPTSVVLSLLLSISPAFAADAPQASVRYRVAVMKALSSHMSAMSLVVKKQVTNRTHLAG
ncbi:MAG: hypothetical protein QOF78_3744, partial [Phycisphaerales bacterium]|nr:hypothetical protein [Phycisphaerales bacterium]